MCRPPLRFEVMLTCHCALIGVMVIVKNEEFLCRARLLYVLCDLPTKAAVFNIMQFNGKYGCPSCMHPGEQVPYTCIFRGVFIGFFSGEL